MKQLILKNAKNGEIEFKLADGKTVRLDSHQSIGPVPESAIQTKSVDRLERGKFLKVKEVKVKASKPAPKKAEKPAAQPDKK